MNNKKIDSLMSFVMANRNKKKTLYYSVTDTWKNKKKRFKQKESIKCIWHILFN